VPYHVIVTPRKPEDRRAGEALALDKDAAWVEERIVRHWRHGNAIFIDGRTFAPDNIEKILITETAQSSRQLMTEARKSPGVPVPPGLEVAQHGHDVTDQFIITAPGTAPRSAATFAANRKAVMVIYGHDTEAKDALFGWLRAIGLQPQEWSQLVYASGSASPYIGQVLDRASQQAQAVIALFTPDEHVRGRQALPAASTSWRLQARPNVLIEAGMALVTHADRTVFVVLGPQELPSDFAGRHYIRLNNTAGALNDMANRLEAAGCEIDKSGTDWLDPARFPGRDNLASLPARPGMSLPEPPGPSTPLSEAAAPTLEHEELHNLIMDGAAIRAGLPEEPAWTQVVPDVLSMKHDAWQERASAVLADWPEWLAQFQDLPLPSINKIGPHNAAGDFAARVDRQVRILRVLLTELQPADQLSSSPKPAP
jgi:predicted nucleotide-binding protein